MIIAIAQYNFKVGDFEKNTETIINAINNAKEKNVDLIVFPELSICGYPPQDLLTYKGFVDKCAESIEKIAKNCINIAALIGTPTYNPSHKGKTLYNSAVFIENNQIKQTINKTLLPTYDVFDEYRYFEPNTDFSIIEYKNERIAVTICEDMWDKQPVNTPLGKEFIYTISPMEELSKLKPTLAINLSASPFAAGRIKIKEKIFGDQASLYNMPLLFVNQIGANTELIFEGGSMVFNKKGNPVLKLPLFEERLEIINTKDINDLAPEYYKSSDIKEIHDSLVYGLKDFFNKLGFKKAILGLSGGIDSAVTLVIAERAIGANNLCALLMPSRYSSDHSIKDAKDLALKLGVEHHIISIEDCFKSFKDSLHPLFNKLPDNIAEENIQARIRGTLLMAMSNKFGNILLNTSNKSEAAVGYGTLYGDMAGSISVLGDVYKTQVFELAKFINKDNEIIPLNTILKPPSAELRPNQKDSDSLPEYDVLDAILYRFIELELSEKQIIEQGYDEQTVRRVISLVNANEYKRYQAPPMLRVSTKAFGIGRRMPLVAKFSQ